MYAAFYKIVDIKLTDLRMYALNMKNSIGLILSQVQNNVLEFSKLDKVLEEVTGCIDKFSKIIYSEAERYRVMQSNEDSNKTLERIGKEKEELIATCYEATEMMCYIATSVYGSYDCPQVWTLRRFRDNTLAKRWFGKCFIKAYYAISPSLVKKFGKNYCFNNFWRYVLDVMVKKLNCQGVENTPYED